MSLDATRSVWKLQGISPTQKLVLLSLADRSGETGECWPSVDRLVFDTGLSRSTIIRSIKDLVDCGLLNKIKRLRKNGTDASNFYALTFVEYREGVTMTPQGYHHDTPEGVTMTPESTILNLPIESKAYMSSGGPDDAHDEEKSPDNSKSRVRDLGCPYDSIVEKYHEILPELPRIKGFTDKRRRHLRKRWEEMIKRMKDNGKEPTVEMGIEWWCKFFGLVVRKSPLLMGEKGSWNANFDWLINQANHLKTLEGNYLDKGAR